MKIFEYCKSVKANRLLNKIQKKRDKESLSFEVGRDFKVSGSPFHCFYLGHYKFLQIFPSHEVFS